MNKRVTVPGYVRSGIRARASCYPEGVTWYGCDTESVDGRIRMIQICDGRGVTLLDTHPPTALRDFVTDMARRVDRGQHWAYFHNLSYDLQSMIAPWYADYLKSESLDILIGTAKVTLHLGRLTFGIVDYGGGRRLRLVDSKKFFPGSLRRAGEELSLPHQKLTAPPGLGERDPWEADLRQYAEADAWVTWELAGWIQAAHRRFDVPPAISFSQYAQYVFQRKFLDDGSAIPYPPSLGVAWAERSYHGGKNGFYCDRPVEIPWCVELDINSAFAYAMTQLPPMVEGAYTATTRHEPGAVGVYCITGRVRPCRYPVLYQNDRFLPVVGPVRRLAVTSYELDYAVRLGVVDLDECVGMVWRPVADSPHPLREYVNFWWAQKAAAVPGSSEYVLAKLACNALYGKFIAAVELPQEADYRREPASGRIHKIEPVYRAGAIYNPMLATLITGFVRVRLHELETRYAALHSATDSVKSLVRTADESKALGGIKIAVAGRCLLIRNKLYLHYEDRGTLCRDHQTTDSHICKFALHGFWGTPDQLRTMCDTKALSYTARRMLRVREAGRRLAAPVPLRMTTELRSLTVDLDRLAPFTEALRLGGSLARMGAADGSEGHGGG